MQLTDVAKCFEAWQTIQDDIDTSKCFFDDPEMKEMAQEELKDAKLGMKP